MKLISSKRTLFQITIVYIIMIMATTYAVIDTGDHLLHPISYTCLLLVTCAHAVYLFIVCFDFKT